MSATTSTMLELGTQVPNFELPDAVSNKKITLNDFDDKEGILIVFMCNHCPAVINIKKGLAKLARDYHEEIGMIGINANDFQQEPRDRPEKMAEDAQKFGYPFPYVYDESQQTAKACHAACTPDFYLVDKEHFLVYRGQFDGSRPGNGKPVTGKDLREAIDRLLQNKPPVKDQKPNIGCNIKWKKGNAPEYYG
jgi:peroxiredoxin